MANSRQLSIQINLKIINLLTGVPEQNIISDVLNKGVSQENLNHLSRIITVFFNYGLNQRGLTNATIENMLSLQTILRPIYNYIMTSKNPALWISTIGKYDPAILNFWTAGEGSKYIPILSKLGILAVSPKSLEFFYLYREELPSFIAKLVALKRFDQTKFIDYLKLIVSCARNGKPYTLAFLEVLEDLIKTDYASLESINRICKLSFDSLIKMKETLNHYLSGTFQANSIENLMSGNSCAPIEPKKRTHTQVENNNTSAQAVSNNHAQILKKLRIELAIITQQRDSYVSELKVSQPTPALSAAVSLTPTDSPTCASVPAVRAQNVLQLAPAQVIGPRPSAFTILQSASSSASLFGKQPELGGVIKPIAKRPSVNHR